MKKNNGKRIAYFLAKWHIHQQIADGASMFAENGYLVDVYLYESSNRVYDFENNPNIRIIDYTVNETAGLIPSVFESEYMFDERLGKKRKVIFGTGTLAQHFLNNYPLKIDYLVDNNEKVWGQQKFGKTINNPSIIKTENVDEVVVLIASSFYKEIAQQLIEYGFEENINFFKAVEVLDQHIFCNNILPESLMEVKRYQYDAFISVEKIGMIWAGMVAENLHIPVPYLYHSLELYTSDHFRFEKNNRLHDYEKKYHKKAKATIIQDEFRERILLNDNEIGVDHETIYLPVSVHSKMNMSKESNYFQEKFGVLEDKIIILLWSIITPMRFCEEIVVEAQKLPSNFQVIIHGPIYGESFLKQLKKLDVRKKVIFSVELVDYQNIEDVIYSADIGLAFYKEKPINEQLTVLSSEKIARYMEASKPIVTFGYENYRKVMNENPFGVYIEDISELKEALIKIVNDYENYSNWSTIAFSKFYDFSRQYRKVIDYIEN